MEHGCYRLHWRALTEHVRNNYLQILGDDNVDDAGMHRDIPIQDIGDTKSNSSMPKVLNKSQPTADTNHFFKKAPRIPGSNKGQVTCNCCQYVCIFQALKTILIFIRNGTDGCPKKTTTTTIVDKVSTLHQHMQAHHTVCFIDTNAHILN